MSRRDRRRPVVLKITIIFPWNIQRKSFRRARRIYTVRTAADSRFNCILPGFSVLRLYNLPAATATHGNPVNAFNAYFNACAYRRWVPCRRRQKKKTRKNHTRVPDPITCYYSGSCGSFNVGVRPVSRLTRPCCGRALEVTLERPEVFTNIWCPHDVPNTKIRRSAGTAQGRGFMATVLKTHRLFVKTAGKKMFLKIKRSRAIFGL